MLSVLAGGLKGQVSMVTRSQEIYAYERCAIRDAIVRSQLDDPWSPDIAQIGRGNLTCGPTFNLLELSFPRDAIKLRVNWGQLLS